jgi:anti-sigma regulatory factor (Ser/Thr protein kinase)
VFDPRECSLVYANAGHLPPLLAAPGELPRRLEEATGPPLGTGGLGFEEFRHQLSPGTLLALYTDGLVERRGRVIDEGIDRLAAALGRASGALAGLPDRLVASLVPETVEDDVALLVARVLESAPQATATLALPADTTRLRDARAFVNATTARWELPDALAEDALLLSGELVTNAMIHGREPIELRLRRTPRDVLIEVDDGDAAIPRKLRPTVRDDHGRGLQMTAAIADRWGTRPLRDGKSVWCQLALARYAR